MPTLMELQTEFAKALNNEESQIVQYIRQNTRLSSMEHLAIYQNSVQGALQNVMKEVFPVCMKLVGNDFFVAMIDQYIATTHSTDPDLGEYGRHFAKFVEHFVPARSLPYLADVARLEWAWQKIFEAAQPEKFDFQKLADCYETMGEKIIFTLPDSSFLLTSPYPVHHIWDINQEDYQGKQQIVLKDDEQFYFLVWRHILEMRIDCIDEHEWQLLKWIQQKMTLAEICHQLQYRYPHANIDEMLPCFVTKGWITGFKLAEDSHHD